MFDAILEMGLSIFQFVFDLLNQIELRDGVSVWSFILVTWIGMALIQLLLSTGASLGSSVTGAMHSYDSKKDAAEREKRAAERDKRAQVRSKYYAERTKYYASQNKSK